jgi:hypothetical protein
MKKNILSLICTLSLSACSLIATAQHAPMPSYNYMPKPDMSFANFMSMNAMFHNYQYYGTVSQKHRFKVILKDSSSLMITAKIDADSLARYLVYTDKSVKRSDSGRTKRIYPSQTLSLTRLDKFEVAEYTGLPADSCWLFPAIEGKLNAYAALAEDEIDDVFLLYVRQGEGPMIKLTEDNLESIVKDNEKAEKLLKKKKYTRAIKKYNGATEKDSPSKPNNDPLQN